MKPVVRRPVWRDGTSRSHDLAEELPVAFEYNGISHAVRLAQSLNITPIGFLHQGACVICAGINRMVELGA